MSSSDPPALSGETTGPEEQLYSHDFVQFDWHGDVKSGEVVDVQDKTIAVRVWEDGEPTKEVRGVMREQARLHPDGRPFVADEDPADD